MRQDVIDFQWERLMPTLEALGFTGPAKRIHKAGNPKLTLVRERHWAWDQWNVTRMRKVTLYANDSYPVTSKSEGVLHVWNDFGSDSKVFCKQVADALTKAGIPSRATTYKKYNVVAFDAGDWMNTPELKEEVA